MNREERMAGEWTKRQNWEKVGENREGLQNRAKVFIKRLLNCASVETKLYMQG